MEKKTRAENKVLMKVFDAHKAAVCGQQESRAGISLDLSTS